MYVDKVNWLRGHPKEAFDMATRARSFTLHHFSRSAVLHDLASLLLGYHLVVTVAATSSTTSSSALTTTISSTSTTSANSKSTYMSNIKDKSLALTQPLSILPEVKIHLWKQFQKQSELVKTLQLSQQSTQQQQQQMKRQTSERSSTGRNSHTKSNTK